MVERFLDLAGADRRDALAVAGGASGRPLHLLEKDVWIVWSLHALFDSPLGSLLTFKGGTSLSKAYGAIRRFSEDVDLTLDIRALIPDLVAEAENALPPTRSQEKKWSKEIEARLARWVQAEALPPLESALGNLRFLVRARAEDTKIFVDYEPLAVGTGYVSPTVLLEFGARSTGEPWEIREVRCDAAPLLPDLEFPTASPRVMRVERTFWEKATAIHVFCVKGQFRGTHRFARHWHDLARLDEAGHADRAITDRDLALAVARHKSIFFAEKDESGRPIDYMEAVQGGLRLVPVGAARVLLAEDYRRVVDDGLLLDDAESFETLLDCCGRIESKANEKGSALGESP